MRFFLNKILKSQITVRIYLMNFIIWIKKKRELSWDFVLLLTVQAEPDFPKFIIDSPQI